MASTVFDLKFTFDLSVWYIIALYLGCISLWGLKLLSLLTMATYNSFKLFSLNVVTCHELLSYLHLPFKNEQMYKETSQLSIGWVTVILIKSWRYHASTFGSRICKYSRI